MPADRAIFLFSDVDGGTAGWRLDDANVSRAFMLAAAAKEIAAAAKPHGAKAAGVFVAAAKTGAAVLDVNSSLETSPGVKSLSRLEDLVAARDRRIQIN